MNTFVNAIENSPSFTTTENGALTLDSSKSALTDLFFYVGASRGKTYEQLEPMFMKAWVEDKVLTTKILLWTRDVRQGAGERQTFRHFIKFLENQDDVMTIIIVQQMIAQLGRIDDLFSFEKHFGSAIIFYFGLLQDDSTKILAAKWFPLKNKPLTNKIRKTFEQLYEKKISPKELRKWIVSLRSGHIVEEKMCAKKWHEIDFSKIPSLAMVRYNNAFTKNAKENYEQYKQALVKGETKVNFGALFPYDLTKQFLKTNSRNDVVVQIEQWKNLENYLGDGEILPVVDVSNSMNSIVGDNPNLTCMDISLSLGLYIADKQEGAFKDLFCTFHEEPKIEKLKGDIFEKCRQLRKADWGGTTNLEKVFQQLMKIAVENNVEPNDLPKVITIISDMEFNHATCGKTNFEKMKEIYKDAGYELPKIIFWNVQSRSLKNVPVKFDENGVALISGFNTHILKNVLSGNIPNPYQVMLDTVNVERYDFEKMFVKTVFE